MESTISTTKTTKKNKKNKPSKYSNWFVYSFFLFIITILFLIIMISYPQLLKTNSMNAIAYIGLIINPLIVLCSVLILFISTRNFTLDIMNWQFIKRTQNYSNGKLRFRVSSNIILFSVALFTFGLTISWFIYMINDVNLLSQPGNTYLDNVALTNFVNTCFYSKQFTITQNVDFNNSPHIIFTMIFVLMSFWSLYGFAYTLLNKYVIK